MTTPPRSRSTRALAQHWHVVGIMTRQGFIILIGSFLSVTCRALTAMMSCLERHHITRKTCRFLHRFAGPVWRSITLFRWHRIKPSASCLSTRPSQLRERSWFREVDRWTLGGCRSLDVFLRIIELRFLALTHMSSSCQREWSFLQLPVRISGCKPSAIFCDNRRRGCSL